MSLFRSRPTVSPYFQGYLAATAAKTAEAGSTIIRLPSQVYGDGSEAYAAYASGVSDSIFDRRPRMPYDRVSRAYPPWRLI